MKCILNSTSPSLVRQQKKTLPFSHHEMLEEPGTHNVCGMFGKDASFVFWFLVIAVQEWGQVQVHLGRKRDEKVSGGEGGVVATETKKVASHHFFGRGRNVFSHHSNAMGVMIPKIKAKEGTFTEAFHQVKELRKMQSIFLFSSNLLYALKYD